MERKNALFRTKWFLTGSIVAFMAAYSAGLVGPPRSYPHRIRTPIPSLPVAPAPKPVIAQRPPPKTEPPSSPRDAGSAPQRTILKRRNPRPAPPRPAPPPTHPVLKRLDGLFKKWQAQPKNVELQSQIEMTLEQAAIRLPEREDELTIRTCVSRARVNPDGQQAYVLLQKCQKRLESIIHRK